MPDGVRMIGLEKEGEGVGLSLKKEKSRMNNLMQSLVDFTDLSESVEQLLMKEPKQSDLTHQNWQDELGIKMCLRILEKVALYCLVAYI